MSLRQKAEKIKGIKQSMRKAALVGLASLVTTTALGEEKGNGKRRPIMQNSCRSGCRKQDRLCLLY